MIRFLCSCLSTQNLTANLLHIIHYLLIARTCFRHSTWLASASYSLLRRIQQMLQVVTRFNHRTQMSRYTFFTIYIFTYDYLQYMLYISKKLVGP